MYVYLHLLCGVTDTFLYGHLLPGADEAAAAKLDDVYTLPPTATDGKS